MVLREHDLPREVYLHPRLWLVVDGFVPVVVASVSAFFGFVYYILEFRLHRRLSVPLVLAHLILFLVAILGHALLVHFMERALGAGAPEQAQLEFHHAVGSAALEIPALFLSLLVFAANVFWRKSITPAGV